MEKSKMPINNVCSRIKVDLEKIEGMKKSWHNIFSQLDSLCRELGHEKGAKRTFSETSVRYLYHRILAEHYQKQLKL